LRIGNFTDDVLFSMLRSTGKIIDDLERLDPGPTILTLEPKNVHRLPALWGRRGMTGVRTCCPSETPIYPINVVISLP
jgi:hypothetical protein